MVLVLSTAGEVQSVVEVAVAPMADHGFSEHDIFGMRLALEEAIVNSLKHGNKNAPDKKVVVRTEYNCQEVMVEVRDEGEGFDPASVPDPRAEENLGKDSGRGLLLMRFYTTWMQYNRVGNAVTLCKRKSP